MMTKMDMDDASGGHGAQISALADGQLRGEEFTRTVRAVAGGDAQAHAAWHMYHLIGDVLRSDELADCGSGAAFRQRLRARLRTEPLPARAREAANLSETMLRPSFLPPPARAREVTNGFRWKMVAGLASLAVIVAVGWNLAVSPVASLSTGAAPQLARGEVPGVPPTALDGPEAWRGMLRDPQLDELLAAHEQASGQSGLQAPAGFLHTTSLERAPR